MSLRTKNIIVWVVCLTLLIGVTFSGQSDILCIGEDGQAELESVCIPCCTELDESCDSNLSGRHQDEHSSCSNCSDVVLGSPQWSNCRQKVEAGLVNGLNFGSSLTAFGAIPVVPDNSRLTKYHKIFHSGDRASMLSTTIIRC